MRRAAATGLLLASLSAGRVPAAEGVAFAGPLTIEGVPSRPVTVHAGDFNGDGRGDLVSSNASGIVSILLQYPRDREMWTQFEVRVGSSSYFTRGGDFDGDGYDDLIVADGASTAYYLRSRGDGTFERPLPITQARGPRWVATGDWNGDGRLDLATSNLWTTTVTVFLNEATPEGLPRFRMTQTPPSGREHSLEALDFDGDGVLDLVVGMGSPGIELHRGNFDGTFTFMSSSNVGELGCAQYLSVGDFNDDGRGDLAPTCSDDGTAYVGISNGDGNYTRTLAAPFERGSESSAAADLNRDGKDDLVLASAGSGQLRVYPSLGDGTFGDPLEFGPIGKAPVFVITADLDRDGRVDVVSADNGGSTLTVFFGRDGERFLQSSDTISGFPPARGFGVGDFDRDGVPDVIFTDAALPKAYIYLKPGGSSPVMPGITVDLMDRHSSLAVADLDGDGIPDLAGTSFDLDSLVVSLLGADGKTHGEHEIPVGGVLQDPRVGRIDPGPTLDLAVPSLSANEISIFLGRGDGKFDAMAPVPTIERPRLVTLADLNGDGRTDLAVLQPKKAAAQLQGEEGTFAAPVLIHGDPTLDFTDLAVSDLNGDGSSDAVLSEKETGRVLVFPGRGDGTFGEMIPIVLGVAPVSLQLTDVDGDGQVDVTASSPTAQAVAISINLGPGGFTPVSLHRVGIGVSSHRILDMNGDGVPDILAFESNSATVRLGYRRGDPPGPLWRRGDANDDGKLDITDGVYVLNFLFAGGEEPSCLEAANANDDPALDLTDPIHVLRFLFLSGPAPLDPGPESCGQDPAGSPSAMGCGAYGSCG